MGVSLAVNMRDGEDDETRWTVEMWTVMWMTECLSRLKMEAERLKMGREERRAPTIIGTRGRLLFMRIEL